MTKKDAVQRLINYLQGEDGYLEKSNAAYEANPEVIWEKTEGAGKDNITKYWERTRKGFQGQAWCQDFVYDAFVQCFGKENAEKMLYLDDWKVGYEPWNNFACASWTENFKAHNATVQSSKTEPGNIIYFTKSHTGIVTEVTDDQVFTCEGNTSSKKGVIPNGGAVVFGKVYTRGGSNIKTYGVPNWDVIKDWDPDPKPVTRPTIYKGYKDSEKGGNFCKEMQIGLDKLGIKDDDGNSITIDGSCGKRSDQAIRNFQKKYGLEVDGRFGPRSWATLDTELEAIKSMKQLKVTAKSGLNVRKGPGTSYGVVKIVKFDTIHPSNKEQNGWAYLTDIGGWASKTYLKEV